MKLHEYVYVHMCTQRVWEKPNLYKILIEPDRYFKRIMSVLLIAGYNSELKIVILGHLNFEVCD